MPIDSDRLHGRPGLPHTLMVRLAALAYEGYTDFKREIAAMGSVKVIDYIDVPPAQAFAVEWMSAAPIGATPARRNYCGRRPKRWPTRCKPTSGYT